MDNENNTYVPDLHAEMTDECILYDYRKDEWYLYLALATSASIIITFITLCVCLYRLIVRHGPSIMQSFRSTNNNSNKIMPTNIDHKPRSMPAEMRAELGLVSSRFWARSAVALVPDRRSQRHKILRPRLNERMSSRPIRLGLILDRTGCPIDFSWRIGNTRIHHGEMHANHSWLLIDVVSSEPVLGLDTCHVGNQESNSISSRSRSLGYNTIQYNTIHSCSIKSIDIYIFYQHRLIHHLIYLIHTTQFINRNYHNNIFDWTRFSDRAS